MVSRLRGSAGKLCPASMATGSESNSGGYSQNKRRRFYESVLCVESTVDFTEPSFCQQTSSVCGSQNMGTQASHEPNALTGEKFLGSSENVAESCSDNSSRTGAESLLSTNNVDSCSSNKGHGSQVPVIVPPNATHSVPGAAASALNDEDGDAAVCGPLQYHCDFCQTDISNVFRVKCAECADFDLCVGCFTSGVETGSHKNTHSYIPIGRNDLSLFTPDWNADEEMMLLEGVSKYGFGNWAEVAELVAPYNVVPKKKEDCERHYYDVHIVPYRVNEPSPAERFGFAGPLDMHNKEHRSKLQELMIGKYHCELPEPLQASPNSAACKIVGFMPLRGDFDVEYDNDAELILSDIEFRGNETPQERELKWKVLDIYNAKLDERILRKRVVIERGLADWRKVQHSGKKKAKEEVDLRNLFRLLVRFNLTPDPDELVQLILTERKLRQRLEIIQEWQSLGLETYEDVEAYEQSKLATLSGLGAGVSGAESRQRSNVKKQAGGKAESETNDPSPTRSSREESSQAVQRKGVSGVLLEAPASDYPGADLLTPQELDFCDQLQLPPVYYLLAKHTLIKAMANTTDPTQLADKDCLRLDATKNGSLYDFILHTEFDLPMLSEPGTAETPTSSSVAPASGSELSLRPTSSPPSTLLRRPRVRRRPLYFEELEDTLSMASGDEKGDVIPKAKKVAQKQPNVDLPSSSTPVQAEKG